MIEAQKLNHKRALIVSSPTSSEWSIYCLNYAQECLYRLGIGSDFLEIKHDHLYDPNLQSQFVNRFVEIIKDAHKSYDFIFSINRMPSNVIAVGGGEDDIYSFSSAPLVTWLVDNIGHHVDFIKRKSLRGVEETVLVADACGVENGDAAGLSLTDDAFFPMWGPARASSQTDDAVRDIPILFVGNINEMEPVEAYRTKASGGDPVLGEVFDVVIERMIDDTGTLDAFSVAREEALKFERESGAAKIFRVVDQMLRKKRRKNAIQTFRRIPITIYGQVSDPEILTQENVTCVGPSYMGAVMVETRRAQILLGDFANFVGGVELRPSIAIANGCVFAGEENTYFREHFPNSSFISTLSENRDVETRVSDILADKDLMVEMDRQAGTIYNKMRNTPPCFIQ